MRIDRALVAVVAALCAASCATGASTGASGSGEGTGDAATADVAAAPDAGPSDGSSHDGGPGSPHADAASHADAVADPDAVAASDAVAVADAVSASDSAAGADSAADAATDAGTEADTGNATDASDGSTIVGPITGGPCVSGAPGATAIRIEFVDANGTADVQWLVEGDPDQSNDSAGAYGYQIGFTPSYVDQYLAQGGVGLDDSDFIDITMSTAGLSNISTATLSLYGRSYDVSTNGSFSWQTFDGIGQTAPDFVSNVPPYQWYSADMTTEIGPGESNVRVRIKAGPSSDALVVNEVEICLVAQ
jgi:hypothetical protein